MHPGDFTHKETHVPIPNTTVKLAGPMIVHTSAKVGYCREHFIKPDLRVWLFLCADMGGMAPVFFIDLIRSANAWAAKNSVILIFVAPWRCSANCSADERSYFK